MVLKQNPDNHSRDTRALSKDYMFEIIQNTIESLIVITVDGTIEMANKAACTLLGFHSKELVGSSIVKILKSKKKSKTEPLKDLKLDEIKDKGFIRNREISYCNKDGTIVAVLFSGSAVKDDKGGVKRIICSATDISDRKKAEDHLKKAKRTAEEANEIKSQFLANMSH